MPPAGYEQTGRGSNYSNCYSKSVSFPLRNNTKILPFVRFTDGRLTYGKSVTDKVGIFHLKRGLSVQNNFL